MGIQQDESGASSYLDTGIQAPPTEDSTKSSIDKLAKLYRANATAPRINTELATYALIEQAHPGKHIAAVNAYPCDILAYQASGLLAVKPSPHNGTGNGPLVVANYGPPASRNSASEGSINERILWAKYEVFWDKHPEPLILYIVDGRDGSGGIMTLTQYIVSDSASVASKLILAAGKFSNDLHGEIWVFDQGYWRKDTALWQTIDKASWDVVILDHEMKQQLIRDFTGFFDSKATYERLKVPWKRGLIFHGPPGNGKTISLKAAMNMLYHRKVEVPTLYVKTLTGFRGPEQSLNDIFSKARATAPCLLVFEDLDTIVSDSVRSFFLNQVDGLAANDGILMVGSTNHLDQLDPGISKRPSRFDRKYLFPNPAFDQRVLYAQFWRRKLGKTDDKAVQEEPEEPEIDFPEELCKPMAEITDKFSFAYMQEAFVATLLTLARDATEENDHSDQSTTASSDGDADLEKLVLWREFQKQVKVLREQIGNGEDESAIARMLKDVAIDTGSSVSGSWLEAEVI